MRRGRVRRAAAAAALPVLAPLVLVLGTAPPVATGAAAAAAHAAHAAPAVPAVLRVVRAYGDGPVLTAPGQGVDVTFRARRGDRVRLLVSNVRWPEHRCYGHLTLRDGRGTRGMLVPGRTLRVRTDGVAVLGYRGRCAEFETDAVGPARVQLQKLRMHHVAVDGPGTRIPRAQRGYVDVAWTRVPAAGRVKLSARDRRGRSTEAAHAFLDNTLETMVRSAEPPRTISVEAGQPVAQNGRTLPAITPAIDRGALVGLALGRRGVVEARTAVAHAVDLDGPAISLEPDRGREHVLSVSAPEGVTTQVDAPPSWSSLEIPGDDTSVRRYAVWSDEDDAGTATDLRVRTVPDLVAGGAPVRYELTEPGLELKVGVQVPADGSYTLVASDVAMSGDWSAAIPGPCDGRSCESPGPSVSHERSTGTGTLAAGTPELSFYLAPRSSGAVTLHLVAAD